MCSGTIKHSPVHPQSVLRVMITMIKIIMESGQQHSGFAGAKAEISFRRAHVLVIESTLLYLCLKINKPDIVHFAHDFILSLSSTNTGVLKYIICHIIVIIIEFQHRWIFCRFLLKLRRR